MKRNWIQNVVIAASIAAISTTALAENKGGFKFNAGGVHTLQSGGQTNISRSLGVARATGGLNVLSNSNQNVLKTQIKTIGSLGNANQGLGISLGNLNSVKSSPVFGKSGPVLNNILKINNSNSNSNKLINPSLIGKALQGNVKQGCIDPGFNKNCSPCKIGCNPWWWGCYHWCQPTYKVCYPVIYTQPIVIQVPVVTEVVSTVAEEQVMQVPAGATLTLQALNLGPTAGQVVLQFNQVALPAMVNEWKADAVTATLPPMGLSANLRAEIIIVKADGSVANTVKVEVIPAQPQSQSTGAPVLTAAAQ